MSSTYQNFRFVIVGSGDPLYSTEINRGLSSNQQSGSSGIQGENSSGTKEGTGGSGSSGGENSQSWFVLHCSLDMVDNISWTNGGMFLKTVDKMMSQQVSAFQTAGSIKFLLIHSGQRQEDSIKNFFHDVYELYVKHSMNPLYKYGTAITSKTFDSRVRASARKYFL
mmetsp:Transcript_39603/g.77444  ORF Transcript_39603/g.77444 Transcript_39603/m.77444 type:complete len:167 (-) Transcript_39603:619-1119(-)